MWMKKTMLILAVLTLLVNCKEKNQQINETGGDGSGMVVNESGNTVPESENDSLNLSASGAFENSALVKNEDESYSFHYNLKKGETYPLNMKISQNQSMKANGQDVNISSGRTVNFDYLVEEVKGNNYKLKATFKEFSENSQGPDGVRLSYNTSLAKPDDKDVAQSWTIYKSITGQSFGMEIDNKGRVISVNGLEKVIGNSRSKLKNEFTAEEQNVIKQMLNAYLSTDAIKTQFEESLNIFPDKNLKIGEKWEDSQNISEGPVKGTNKVTRTFQQLENGVAKIKVSGQQDVSGNETRNGVTATMKNHSTIDGYIDLDTESGWVRKMNITKKETASTTFQQGEQKETESGSSIIVTTIN